MKLSDGEKLILLMLCDIHRALKIESNPDMNTLCDSDIPFKPASGIDPDFVASAISSNNLWGLRLKYSWLFGPDEFGEAVVSEVYRILEMWRVIERSLDSYADEPRVFDEAGTHLLSRIDPRFRGFGNDEHEHREVASFLINDLKEFEVFFGRDLSADFPLLEKYRKMYEVYEPIRKVSILNELDPIELVEILKEMQGPKT
jgi:hypothetical protein